MLRKILGVSRRREARGADRKFRPGPLQGLEDRAVPAVTLPAGFTATVVTDGFLGPTSLATAPDGRVFVTEAGGAIRVVKNGQLLPTPFATVPVDGSKVEILQAVAFDPNFATNQYVYAYYVTDDGSQTVLFNRLVRFTANGDTAAPGSMKVLVDLPKFVQQPGVILHEGAAIHFGADGKLYLTTGALANDQLAQSLSNPFGKLLRFNADGTIPRDNPFYRKTTGVNRAIYALGFRNPYTFAVQPGTGVIYVNDVGGGHYEEINKIQRGGNYGWPVTEGFSNKRGYVNPVYSYAHIAQPNFGNVAISGGAFYNPVNPTFPQEYVGSYFFEDYGNGWVKRLDASGQVHDFASGLPEDNNDLRIDPNGNIFILNYMKGSLTEISYSPDEAPGFASPMQNQVAPPGGQVTFRANPQGSSPFQYQWQLDGVGIPGATGASLTVPASAAGAGHQYRVVVTNAFGTAVSDPVSYQVSLNQPPVAVILTPAAGKTVRVGQSLRFSGAAVDPQSGALPASAYRWRVDLLHNDHSHPNSYTVNGKKSGSFRVPPHGGMGDKVGYRVLLTVTAPDGLSTTVSRDVWIQH